MFKTKAVKRLEQRVAVLTDLVERIVLPTTKKLFSPGEVCPATEIQNIIALSFATKSADIIGERVSRGECFSIPHEPREQAVNDKVKKELEKLWAYVFNVRY